MANLGTLWFGADIDLTNLKQKIQQGNKDVLDALKLSYDPASYQQMVSKLKDELGREKFDIKVEADLSQVKQSILEIQKGGQITPITPASLRGTNDLIERLNDIEKKIQGAIAALRGFRSYYQEALTTKGKEHPETLAWKNSYEDARKTVAFLRKEQEALYRTINTSTATHKSHTTTLQQQSQATRQLTSDSLRLNTTLAGGIHISTRLGSALSSLFAIHTARQFLEQVIEIGGQLEKQRISMQAILGDVAKANELFGQIKDLAIKSPFGVVELDQYSKQLAAYGFEANELYDMTKRLADISAGAGQDIGRLTLALGHVRSATYLTGITLRQFSMNNIPMLKMLADYYSELEGRIVSTAEVQKRISKREVSYEDVITQIKRLTDEGGMFYNMQEKISDSLAAKFKNLHDAFDIMYGEIAESQVGDALKYIASALTKMAREWKSAVGLLGVGASIFAVHKVNALAFSKSISTLSKEYGLLAAKSRIVTASEIDNLAVKKLITKEQLLNAVATKRLSVDQAELAATNFSVTRSQLQQIATGKLNVKTLTQNAIATSKYTVAELRTMAAMNGSSVAMKRMNVMAYGLTNAFRSLGVAMKALLFNPFTIAFAALGAITEAIMHFKQKNDDLKESIKAVRDAANEGYKNLTEAFEKVANVNADGMDNTALKNGIDEIVQSLKEYDPNVNAVLREANAITNLAERYIYLREQLQSTKDAYSDMDAVSDVVINANEKTGSLVNDTLTENLEDYLDKLGEVNKKEADLFQYRVQLSRELDRVQDDSFQKQRRNEDGTLKTLKDQISLLYDNKRALDLFTRSVHRGGGDLYLAFTKYDYALRNSRGELLNVMSDMEQFAQYLDASYIGEWGEAWKTSAAHQRTAMIQVRKMLESIDGMTEDVERDMMDRLFNKIWKLNINFDGEEAQQELTDLQKFLQGITTADWVVKVKAEADVSDVVDDVEKSIKDINTHLPKIKPAVAKGGYDVDKLKAFGKQLYEAEVNSNNLVEASDSDRKRRVTEVTKEMNTYIDSMQSANAAQKEAARSLVDMYKQTENNNAFKNSGFYLDEGKKKIASSKDELLESAKTQFEELKSFLNEYKKYREVYGKEKSIDLLEKMFPTTRGKGKQIVENFKVVLSYVKNSLSMDSEARKKFGISIDKYIADFDLDNAKRLIDDALRDVQEYVSRQSERYNLYKTIFEKTGKKGLAMSAFEDGRVWDDISREFERKLQEAVGGADINYNMTDAEAQRLYDGNKEAYELWKKIVEITRKNYTDALTKGAEALAKEYTMEEKILAAEAKIAELREKRNNATDENARKAYDAQIRSEEKNLGKLNWEAFTKGSDYINFFSATLALTNDEVQKTGQTIKQGLANALRDGAITAHDYAKTMKDVNDRMEESAVAWRSNFGAFLQGGQKGVVNRNQSKLAKASEELEQAQEKYNKLRQEGYDEDIANEESLLSVKEEAFKNAAKALGISQANYQQLNKIYNITQIITGALDGLSQIASNLSEMFDALGKQGDANFWGDVADSINGISSAFKPINNLLSNAMSGNVSGIVSSAISAPVEMFTAPITAFAKLHDKQKEREIQASKQREKEMENMSKNLETALDRSLSSVYGIKASEKMLKELEDKIMSWSYVPDRENPIRKNGMTTYPVQKVYQRKSYIEEETENAMKNAEKTGTYYDTQYALLLAQRDELKHQMQMEEDKKKTNAQAIADYKQQLTEMDDEIKHFAIDMAKALYDIDVKGWADELGDALFEAWQKGEDGAKAFEDKVGEIISNITKNIITAKIIGEALKPIESFISSQMELSHGKLDPTAFASGLADKLNTAFGMIDAALFPALDATEAAINKWGYTMKEAGSESGLTAGIKGITEETADILASYVNAIRADVSLIRESQLIHLPIISEACMRGNILAEQQVLEQRQIAANTLRNAEAAEMIYDILHGNVLGANRFAIA